MLLTDRIARAVADGEVRSAYRRWKRPRVQAGETFRTVAGVVRVDRIETVLPESLNENDAREAGYASLPELTATFRGSDEDPVFRIGLSWAEADPRESLARNAELDAEDIAEIEALLEQLDARTPWARAALSLIDESPGITAAALADAVRLEKESLKRRIRTLKEHGLTRSLRVGYELSERGRAYLQHSGVRRRRR